jgi:phage anti-repressor protein
MDWSFVTALRGFAMNSNNNDNNVVSITHNISDLVNMDYRAVGEVATQTVSAKELHKFLNVRRDFSNWIKDRIDKYSFNENEDFLSLLEKQERAIGATIRKEYYITLDMAKELSMVENNKRGKLARKYFIECERKAKQQKPAPARGAKALLAMVQQLVEIEEEQERQSEALEVVRVEQKQYKAELRALDTKIEHSTGMAGYFTVMAFATLKKIRLDLNKSSEIGRTASAICRKRKIYYGKVKDIRFGLVGSYPEEILDEVFIAKKLVEKSEILLN